MNLGYVLIGPRDAKLLPFLRTAAMGGDEFRLEQTTDPKVQITWFADKNNFRGNPTAQGAEQVMIVIRRILDQRAWQLGNPSRPLSVPHGETPWNMYSQPLTPSYPARPQKGVAPAGEVSADTSNAMVIAMWGAITLGTLWLLRDDGTTRANPREGMTRMWKGKTIRLTPHSKRRTTWIISVSGEYAGSFSVKKSGERVADIYSGSTRETQEIAEDFIRNGSLEA